MMQRFFVVGSVVLSVLLFLVGLSLHMMRGLEPLSSARGMGATIGGMLAPFLITGLFMIFRRFRNRRAFWKILFWVTLLLLISTINQWLLLWR
jgi:hypothetical protein